MRVLKKPTDVFDLVNPGNHLGHCDRTASNRRYPIVSLAWDHLESNLNGQAGRSKDQSPKKRNDSKEEFQTSLPNVDPTYAIFVRITYLVNTPNDSCLSAYIITTSTWGIACPLLNYIFLPGFYVPSAQTTLLVAATVVPPNAAVEK